MEKLTDSLLQTTLDFAKQHYGDKQTITGGLVMAHCTTVARQAETIAKQLYQDVRHDFMPDDTKESIVAIIQGALLHDVLNVSACAFEHIAEIASVQIAAMVADISRDFRLVETKRDMEFRGRLSQSPASAQIVVVADIICTAGDTLRLIDTAGAAALPRAKKILAQLDGDLLAIHAANKYYVLRLYVHAARNLLRDISTVIKDCKAKIKLDKIAAQNTKAIAARIVARKKSERAQKKQESQHAKKHCIDADPQ